MARCFAFFILFHLSFTYFLTGLALQICHTRLRRVCPGSEHGAMQDRARSILAVAKQLNASMEESGFVRSERIAARHVLTDKGAPGCLFCISPSVMVTLYFPFF